MPQMRAVMAGDDVDDLVHRPADDQALEIARRLEDLQPCGFDGAVAHAQVQRALALDAGKVADVDREIGPARGNDRVMHRAAPSGTTHRWGQAGRPRRR